MANFINALKNTQRNVKVTENGMQGFKTTMHPLVDFNFKLPSFRGNDYAIVANLNDIMRTGDSKYILKYMFYLRDVREGLGERNTFRVMLKTLVERYSFANKDEIIKEIVEKDIKEYGRFDDLFVLMGTKYEDTLINAIKTQLRADLANADAGKPFSLLAKWMPSANTSSKDTRALAKKVIKALGASEKEYRQLLSKLRGKLKVVEVDTSANRWADIDYNAVPSNANLKYKDAFLKHDEERRRDYLAALRVGKDKDGKEVKINSKVNFPHQIVNQYKNGCWYVRNYDDTLEASWKALKDKPGLADTIVVRDGSGSMTSHIPGSNVAALDVADALTIYTSERLTGSYKDYFITFSSKAQLVYLGGKDSLHAKLDYMRRFDDCSNTNIENVFALLLNTAIQNKLTQDEMPKQVLIISDMEFDASRFGGSTNVFINADAAFKKYGYTMPKLVFWNVNSRTNTMPITMSENGVILVSGFSVNILDMVMSGKTDPFDVLTEKLDTKRYENIPYLSLDVNAKLDTEQKTTKLTEKPAWL